VLLGAPLGFARAENITLYLKNGDRITGSVVSEYTNRLVLSNSWAKDLSVPLAEIARREITVAVSTNAVTGTNHLAGSNRALSTNILAKLKAPPPPATPPPLFKHWKAEAEVGLDLIYSTTEQQTYHGRFKLSYELPYTWNPKNFFRNTLDYSVSYGKTRQKSTATPTTTLITTSSDQMGASDKTSADFDTKWYAYNLAGIGFDRVREIDLHIEEGPGLGYHLLTLSNVVMNVESGANYQIQYDTDGGKTRDFFYRLAEDVTWKLNSRTTWTEKEEFFPRINFSEFRLRAESTLSYNLWRYVYLNLTARDSYDTRPAPGVKPNELEFHSALGVKF
jgi:hypothetical protein